MRGRVLIVAGSDSGGGAGIQADIKTVTALGGYAMTAITALTAQDTRTVHAIHEVPAAFVRRQMEVVLADLGADCLKTGMLHRDEVVLAIVEALEGPARGLPLVADPVMVAKGGARLLEEQTVGLLRQRLLPFATVLTPNAPEAELLSGRPVRGPDDLEPAGRALLDLGAKAVLMKGGHLPGDTVLDLLVTPEGAEAYKAPRIGTPHTHGTGCTLASAIATGLAQHLSLRDAVARARDYVRQAILTAPNYGTGHGPLNHAHTVREA